MSSIESTFIDRNDLRSKQPSIETTGFRRSEGAKERSSEAAKQRSSEGAKERRSEGAKERRSEGAKERRSEGAKESIFIYPRYKIRQLKISKTKTKTKKLFEFAVGNVDFSTLEV